MKIQNDRWSQTPVSPSPKRKFLAVSLQTWIWVAILIAAIPLVNNFGFPILLGIGVLILLGLTFWKSGRAVREDIEKPMPEEN